MIRQFHYADSALVANPVMTKLAVLQRMIDCLVELNIIFLRDHGSVPPVASSGVVLCDQHGRESLDTISVCLERGCADHAAVAAWRVAELREAGYASVAKVTYRVDDHGGVGWYIRAHWNGHDEWAEEILSREGKADEAFVRKHKRIVSAARAKVQVAKGAT